MSSRDRLNRAMMIPVYKMSLCTSNNCLSGTKPRKAFGQSGLTFTSSTTKHAKTAKTWMIY